MDVPFRTAWENSRASNHFSAAAALDGGGSLDKAIREAIAKYGPGDPRIGVLVQQASSVCSGDPDPYDSSHQDMEDRTRLWAVKRVMELCQGYTEESYNLSTPPPNDAALVKKNSGVDAAVQDAFFDIAHAPNRYSVTQAGMVLFETGKFPFSEVLPGAEQRFGMADLTSAWAMAVDLALCGEQSGCGPNSLEVAAFCMYAGCPLNSDLLMAYQHALPNDKYQAVIAFAQWIANQRLH